jgi:hypothetical protein
VEIRTAERALDLLAGLERRLKQRDRSELEEHLGHLERLAESLPEAHPVRLLVESAVRSARTRGATSATDRRTQITASSMAVGARPRCGPEAAVGETLRRRSTDTGAGPSGSFVAFGGYGHASEGAETLR